MPPPVTGTLGVIGLSGRASKAPNMIMSKVELRVFKPRVQVKNIPQISASPHLIEIDDKKIALFKSRVHIGEVFFFRNKTNKATSELEESVR